MVPGQSYPLAVRGNTNGNFTTQIKAYIDWNHDGVFSVASEGYTIGDLINSTGADGKEVTASITVPETALAGPTRMRVIKKFGATANPEPCNAAGYGQAEDYTIIVGVGTPGLAKSFSPAVVAINETSAATITLTNPTANDATLVAPLVDTFPAGLSLSAAETTCGLMLGSKVSLLGDTVILPVGVVLPAGTSCEITASAQSATVGAYVNALAAGALQTDQG
ncbi:MAG: GEVED domain-containing protein, partial [Dokdonella sp.]